MPSRIERSARAGLALDCLLGDRRERLVGDCEIDALHLEQPLVLLHQRVLRLGQDPLERRLVEVLERGNDRQSPDKFRDQPVFQQVLRLDVAEDLTGLAVFRRDHLGGKADAPPARITEQGSAPSIKN